MEMDKTFKPNPQWMAEKYNEMNQLLFNGALGACDFAIFTSGRGSEGGVLGWFKITARNIRVDRYSRRMFANQGWNKAYIDKSNFVDLCRPRIELNGNYTGTEHSFLATLVHEMCHYYTYMYGYAPKQGHGREFKEIGYVVSQRSNGMFTIQRLASAEQMTEMELSDEMKAKRAKRLSNRKSSVTAILVFTKKGEVKLTISSNPSLINMISSSEKERGENVVTTNNAEVIEYLFDKGYRKNMRTWRYWSLEGKPWLEELKGMLPEVSGETLGVRRPAAQQVPPQQQPRHPKRIFSIKTSNGVFEHDGENYYSLLTALKERFPRTSEEGILKLINNPANYRMVENMINAKSIIKEVIEEFMNDEMGDDSVAINPDMNLGLQSPLEGE
jgi:predicted SprT family Zn-dependent metalloprotease